MLFMKRITLMLLALAMTLALSAACAQAVIGLGSTGRDAAELQEALTELGYYTAEITGHFGSKTQQKPITA